MRDLLTTTGLASSAEWDGLTADDQVHYLDELNDRGVALQAQIIAAETNTTPRAVLAQWVRAACLSSDRAFAVLAVDVFACKREVLA